MHRRFLVVGTVAALMCSATIELDACGDKFLRAGRSARAKGYATIHPASILVFKPDATPKGLQEFEAMLKKAGHKPVTLRDGALLSKTLSASQYDLVIADYADTATLRTQLGSSSPQPGLLPIVYKPSKSEETEVRRQYPCFLNIDKMTKYDALAEIDHVMELRLKKNAAAAK